MELKTFLLLASQDERESLAAKASTTVNYLQKISSTGKCSPLKAFYIAEASKEMSRGHVHLRPINVISLVRHPSEYKRLLKQVRAA